MRCRNLAPLAALTLAAALALPDAAIAEGRINNIGKITTRASGGQTVVTIPGSSKANYTAYRLEAPPRLVIDIADSQPGANGATDVVANTGVVGRIGVASLHEENSRTVVTIGLAHNATYDIRASGNDIVVTFNGGGAGGEQAPSPAAHPAEPKSAPPSHTKAPEARTTTSKAPEARTTTSKAPTRTKTHGSIKAVDFQDRDDVARVVIAVPPSVQMKLLGNVGTGGEHAVALQLRGVELPDALARTLDTSAYKGPVTSVSTFVDPEEPGAVRVVTRLASAVVPTVRREGDRVYWSFPKASSSASRQRVASAGGGAGGGGGPAAMQYGAAVGAPEASANGAGGAGESSGGGGGGLFGGRRRHYTGQHIDLDFKDVDIHNMMRVFSKVGNVNIVIADDVKGTVTVLMHDVPWDQALDVVLRSKGLGMTREGNLIRVAPQATLDKEYEQENARVTAQANNKPIGTKLFPLSYATGDKILPRIQDVLSPRGRVSFDERTNTLIVSDISGNLALADQLLHNLDTQTPQVLIEARIVEARTGYLRDIGIQWGVGGVASAGTGNPTGLSFPSTVAGGGGATDNNAPIAGLNPGAAGAASPNFVVNMPAPVATGQGGAVGLTLGSIAGNLNVNLRLSAAENTGNVRIISAPKITTLDNVEANIEQGVSIPVTVTSALGANTIFVDATLRLTAKPHITNEGSVFMALQITKNEPDFSQAGANGTPSILKKQAKTEMLVRDGDTAVIGGIYTRNTGTSYNKVPLFGDIPILGWLFKHRRENDDRNELLIFITPRIVNRNATQVMR